MDKSTVELANSETTRCQIIGAISLERETCDFFIVGAVTREAACEEHEAFDLERLRREAGAALDEFTDLARSAAFPAGERDVRVKGSPFRFEADLLADPFDFCGERCDGRFRLDTSPQGATRALLEATHTRDP